MVLDIVSYCSGQSSPPAVNDCELHASVSPQCVIESCHVEFLDCIHGYTWVICVNPCFHGFSTDLSTRVIAWVPGIMAVNKPSPRMRLEDKVCLHAHHNKTLGNQSYSCSISHLIGPFCVAQTSLETTKIKKIQEVDG